MKPRSRAPSFRRRWIVSLVGAALLAGVVSAEPTPSASAPAASPMAGGLPATGQLQAYPSARRGSAGRSVPVPDDGTQRAGLPLRYRDNGDGTISDLNTGLRWEKKCSGCDGLHDDRQRLPWSGDGKEATAWDWIDELNAVEGRGFAGFADWRLPNVKELVSLVDYGAAKPAIASQFRSAECRSGCADPAAPTCSCTTSSTYWTATTFSDFPAHALAVDFGYGFVDDRLKTTRQLVRAVRNDR